jgi:polysaccharide biosynthesis protein PslH
MPDLLFLTQRIPFPPNKGEKIRALHLLRHLRRSFDVHLGCLVDDPQDLAHRDTVRALCRDAHFAALDRRRAYGRCLAALAAGRPLSVEFFRDAGLARWVDRVLDEVRPAAVVVCSSNMAPYVLDHRFRPAALVADIVDVDSEKWREYAARTMTPMRLIYARERRLVAALERRIAAAADHSTFVSETEAALFRSVVGARPGKVHGVGNGVEHAYFDPALPQAPPYDAGRPNFVFTGVMDYPPNVDAVTWFAEEVLPRIRAALPDAQFHVVGSSPARAVRRLAARDGVHVTGRVPDVRPYLAHATAAVAPLRIARGIQNKVLEAMAMARPVIVTPAALEGIAAEPGREVVLCESAAEMAEAACRLAGGSDGEAIGAAARRRVVANFSWSETLRRFDRLLQPALRGEPAAMPMDAAGRRR